MSPPLLSIIVPTLNRSQVITRCIDSILRQSFEDFELIIVDSSLDDETKIVVEQYRITHPSIRYLYCKVQRTSVQVALGVDYAQGKFIGFVDSDDYVGESFFRNLVQNAIDYQADISGFREFVYISEENAGEAALTFSAQDSVNHTAGVFYDKKGIRRHVFPNRGKIFPASRCRLICKRSLFDANFAAYRDLPDVFWEDVLFSDILLLNANSLVLCDGLPYYYVQHQTSTSRMKPDSITYGDYMIWFSKLRIRLMRARGYYRGMGLAYELLALVLERLLLEAVDANTFAGFSVRFPRRFRLALTNASWKRYRRDLFLRFPLRILVLIGAYRTLFWAKHFFSQKRGRSR